MRTELIKGTFTSVDLVQVFGERCQTIARYLNLSTEELFEDAIKLAQKCDKERKEAVAAGQADKLPILHGVPMSVKDCINQKGCLSTVGTAFLCE